MYGNLGGDKNFIHTHIYIHKNYTYVYIIYVRNWLIKDTIYRIFDRVAMKLWLFI